MGRTIKLILYFFAYQLAVSSVFTGLYMLWNGSFEMPDPNTESYVNFLLSVQVAFTLLFSMHLVLGKYVNLDRRSLAYASSFKLMTLSLLFMVGMGLWNNYLSELLDLPNTMEDFFVDMMSHPLGIFAAVIMAPVMEELLFRGAIEGHLLRIWKNPVWAILLSSVLFGLVHCNPVQIPFAIVIGLALGWIYYMTESLFLCMFMHFINNGSAVLVFWLTDNPKTTLVGTFGDNGAIVLALIGMVATLLSVLLIQKVMRNTPPKWYNVEK